MSSAFYSALVFIALLVACVILEIFTKGGAGWLWLGALIAFPTFTNPTKDSE